MPLIGQDRVLGAALGISLAFHTALLAVHFKLPDTLRSKTQAQPLEVVLVNAKTRERPARAELLAQANLDRGGNADDRRRARTPLPVTEPKNPGKDLAAAQKRSRQVEVRQRDVLAQNRESPARVATGNEKRLTNEDPAEQTNGRDMADLALAAMRLQAQLDRQLKEYAERPRMHFIGSRATEYRFAQYEEDWRVKVERLGTLNYPAGARGKLYGNLRLTVHILADGTVSKIELDRSSGLKLLDDAAFKIVKMATPFAAFPPNIRRDIDILVITRTWFFGQGDKIWTE
jgi:periplasmic protein TonB